MEVTHHDFVDWRAQQTSFEDLGAFYSGTVNISGNDLPERYDGGFMTASVFTLLRVTPLMGRLFTEEDSLPGAAPVTILGYNLWERSYNADPEIVGKTIRVNGRDSVVIGVMRRHFKFPTQEDIWLPLEMDLTKFERGDASVVTLEVVGRLKDGVTLEQARAEFKNIAAAIAAEYPDINEGVSSVIKPYTDEYIAPEQKGMILLMFGFVVFVLLIACANVANLILVRNSAKQRELAIRSAIGAERWRLMVHVLAEAVIVSALGALFGLWIADIGLDEINRVLFANEIQEPFWIKYEIDMRVVFFASFISMFAALVAGMAPALRASKVDVNEHLKDGSKGSSGAISTLSKVLVAGEIFLSCILLVGAGLLIRSVVDLNKVELGANTEGLLTGRIGLFEGDYPTAVDQAAFFQELSDRLNQAPGAQAAAASISLPGMFAYSANYFAEGEELTDGQLPSAHFVVSTPSY
ncbi:MAG: ABC transporter permease, partial [Gammaproteobacteria bacterium]|nr:ABC transporter permease [Gammaproteobacteria bacterium]